MWCGEYVDVQCLKLPAQQSPSFMNRFEVYVAIFPKVSSFYPQAMTLCEGLPVQKKTKVYFYL